MSQTYNDLLLALQELTVQLLECDVTVEDCLGNECHQAELRVCGSAHEILDENHPVIYFS